jgi:hypothetical protein
MMSRLTINASLEPFRAGNRLELFIDIVLARRGLCRSVPLMYITI